MLSDVIIGHVKRDPSQTKGSAACHAITTRRDSHSHRIISDALEVYGTRSETTTDTGRVVAVMKTKE